MRLRNKQMLCLHFFAASLFTAGNAVATETSLAFLDKLTGCYDVSYTFESPGSEPYRVSSVEWIEHHSDLGWESLVHIMPMGPKYTFRHFSQMWRPTSQAFAVRYLGGTEWEISRNPLAANGLWTELISQVDGSPRYSGSGILNNAGWANIESSMAAVPRRDENAGWSKIERKNQYQLGENGWIHSQHNKKYRGEIAELEESGTIVYTRAIEGSRSMQKCAGGASWWQSKKNIWLAIDRAWLELLSPSSFIKIGEGLSDDIQAFIDAYSNLAEDQIEVTKGAISGILKKNVIVSPSSNP